MINRISGIVFIFRYTSKLLTSASAKRAFRRAMIPLIRSISRPSEDVSFSMRYAPQWGKFL
jgi:hypothetical protein